MINARDEFLAHIKNTPKVMCAEISYTPSFSDKSVYAELPCGYSEADFQEFLKTLDFLYDNGYGSQNLYGTIWFYDGSWSDRGEYDGAEWWEHRKAPEIPDNLKEK